MKTPPARLHVVGVIAATVTAMCASAGASAQSSVTLSGIVDAAARHVNNEGRGSVSSLVSGSNSTSRIAVRGNEDLGDGLSAGFHLEHGLLLDAGTAASTTLFWDRRSTVSLLSRTLGELRLGRDFVPTYVNWSRYDPFSYVGVAGANNFVSATPAGPIRSAYGTGGNTTVRSSNSIQYLLPSGFGGLEGGVMVAAGEAGSAANGQHKVMGARLGFATSGWGISVAHTRTENDLTVAGSHKDSAVGVNVALAGLKLTAAFRAFSYDQAKQRNLLIGAVVPVGAVGEVKASVHGANMSGRVGATLIDENDATQVGLGYVHNLSKRTALYTTLSRISNSGAAAFVVPGGPAGMAGGGNSSGFEAGLRHTF